MPSIMKSSLVSPWLFKDSHEGPSNFLVDGESCCSGGRRFILSNEVFEPVSTTAMMGRLLNVRFKFIWRFGTLIKFTRNLCFWNFS